jgi:hypothetical protein
MVKKIYSPTKKKETINGSQLSETKNNKEDEVIYEDNNLAKITDCFHRFKNAIE